MNPVLKPQITVLLFLTELTLILSGRFADP